MPYIDWAMVIFTLVSCVSMLFESPWPTTGENLVMNNIYLQVILDNSDKEERHFWAELRQL